MISRRNIRVKVMQTLYAMQSLHTGHYDDSVGTAVVKLLDEKIRRAEELFLISLGYVFGIAKFAEKDAHTRASKYLPTSADLKVSTKISGNVWMWRFLEQPDFKPRYDSVKVQEQIDTDWIKKLYEQLTKTVEYQAYIARDNRETESEKQMLLFIWKEIIRKNESLMEHFADEINDWQDDEQMMDVLIENFLSGQYKYNFKKLLADEKYEYAKELSCTVLEKSEYLMSIIEPRLKNWDKDRVAQIDILLLKMGISELLYFPTIPTRVTINEYIEIAKNYSTPQSGQFVNGVLDNLLKDFTSKNLINKTDRKVKKT